MAFLSIARVAVITTIVALLAPWVYERAQILSLFHKNDPERLPRINTFKSSEIKFADKIRNCEDALLVESAGLAIVACDSGREKWNTVMGVFLPGPIASGEVYIYDYTKPGARDSKSLSRLDLEDFRHADDFHPLGMAFDEASSTLYITNHQGDGPAIELFKVDLKARKAKHLRSIQHPLLRGPNAILLRNKDEFFVTNDHHFLAKDNRFLSMAETYLAIPLGTVVHVDISDPTVVKANVVARVAFANGIEFVNRTTLAVASSSRAAVLFYKISDDEQQGTVPKLKYHSLVRVPFGADNISPTSGGGLLIAGHPHVPSFSKYTDTRHICNDPAELAKAESALRSYCETGKTGAWVSEWSETSGLKHVYAGTDIPTSSTAVYDASRGVGIITGLYGKGILVWRN